MKRPSLRADMELFYQRTGKGALTHWFEFLKWRRQRAKKKGK